MANRLWAISSLKLDDQNPRLPPGLQGKSQSELLRYLFDKCALEELATSFIDNGFFPHEPLAILAEPEEDGKHVVLEGNRRLAALMILLAVPEAADLSFASIEHDPEALAALREVPCFPVVDRDAVHTFLGFRHIGGIKKWSAEAKARYLANEVQRAVQRGEMDPFRVVGRQVGSNALGVRGPYMALRILQHAAEEFGIDTHYVQYERFGVWLRCMNSAEIRGFIGFGGPKTYSEVEAAVAALMPEKTREVIRDLTPQEGRPSALIADSRLVTDYGRILAKSEAYKALRKHGDLVIAQQVVEQSDLASRMWRISESCKLLLDQLSVSEISTDLLREADALLAVVRSIRSLIKGRLEEDEQN